VQEKLTVFWNGGHLDVHVRCGDIVPVTFNQNVGAKEC